MKGDNSHIIRHSKSWLYLRGNLLRGNVAQSANSTSGGAVVDEVAVSKGLHTIAEIPVDNEYLVPFRSQNRLSHPFYWEPFVLFGNSR